jgi:hypothetical protein
MPAFGDKQSLYLKALDRYWERGEAAMREALAYDRPLDEGLMRVYTKALSIYFSGEGRPRGCFAIGTATTEAVQDPEIRTALAQDFAVSTRASRHASGRHRKAVNCLNMRCRNIGDAGVRHAAHHRHPRAIGDGTLGVGGDRT